MWNLEFKDVKVCFRNSMEEGLDQIGQLHNNKRDHSNNIIVYI